MVHRQVRVAQQLGHGLAVPGEEGHADAGGDEQLVVLNLVRHSKSVQKFLRSQHRGLLVGLARQHNRELVAAHAPGQIVFGEQQLQTLAHFLQQPVAHGVAQDIVDLLEAVQIDEQNRQASGPLAGIQQAPPPAAP